MQFDLLIYNPTNCMLTTIYSLMELSLDVSILPDLEDYKHIHMAKNLIGTLLPHVVFEESKNIGTTSAIGNQTGDYKHAMDWINGLEKTMSTIASSIQPLVAAWNNKGFQYSDLDKVSLL